MKVNNIREYVACVNGGSGVLFQPADENCTYVLTAKHVFDDIISAPYNGNFIIHYYNKASGNFLAVEPLVMQQGENYFPHEENSIDIAIIKIPKLDVPDNIIVESDCFRNTEDYLLVGFPWIRRNNNGNAINLQWLRIDNHIAILQEKEARRIEADISKNQTLGELIGNSGGGIFKISSGHLLLIGIQSRVANENEALGRIEFTPIEIFNEIVAQFPGKLEHILPAYLKNFSFLKDESFQITAGIKSVDTVKEVSQILRNHTQNIIDSDFTPNCIKKHFGSAVLLMYGQEENSIFYRPLWTAWLEVLTILIIAKQKQFAKSDFDELFRSVRFFYSSTEKDFWVAHLEDLAKSNYKGLDKDGLVIVASIRPAIDNMHILDSEGIPERIDHIKKEYEIETLAKEQSIDINSGTEFPFKKFKFVNLSVFKENPISENFEQFKNMPVGDIIPKLKSLYEQLIK